MGMGMGDEVSGASAGAGEQLSLVRAVASPRGRARAMPAVQQAAEVDPVALVLVDVGLPHLDRSFEYLVPASLADLAVPGARVKVRFAGQDVDGYVLARAATAGHDGTLAPLRKVVSPESVLTPQVLAVCREMAGRYAGTLGDMVRLAVPPRHATAERNLPKGPPNAAGSPGGETAGGARRLVHGCSTRPGPLSFDTSPPVTPPLPPGWPCRVSRPTPTGRLLLRWRPRPRWLRDGEC
jgi:primosomal protein N' (replication factor Y)